MDLRLLYGENCNIDEKIERIEKLKKSFSDNEGINPTHVFSSSGRAEILGNHTDHNHGLVMVASISCDVVAVVAKRNDNVVKICSEGYPAVEVDLSNLSVKESEKGKSDALARGVADAISKRGFNIGGFTAYTSSNIFKGAGVSSSAAFEVLVAEIFNTLYLHGKLSDIDRAVISQYAENVYFGKPCGLLDQSGISIGSLVKLDFNQPEKPEVKKLQAPSGYTLVITNTGGNHAALTEHYAAIRSEMEEVASFFGKKVLRDVPRRDFEKMLPTLKRRFSGRAILRALHFYNENDRVIKAQNALLSNDTATFLDCVNKSGESSLTLLQNCYVPGDVKQPVVLGIELSKNFIKDGACRVHGGGFAGSILAIVNDNEVKNYVQFMKKMFGDGNVFEALIRPIGTTLVEVLR
ncbi:MAG: galactokinase [Clostridiales bacterium]|nr:galactokinase [Clostridiales bacterium]